MGMGPPAGVPPGPPAGVPPGPPTGIGGGKGKPKGGNGNGNGNGTADAPFSRSTGAAQFEVIGGSTTIPMWLLVAAIATIFLFLRR
jgi:hypothetical protein